MRPVERCFENFEKPSLEIGIVGPSQLLALGFQNKQPPPCLIAFQADEKSG